jgi:hypothetical protein
VRRTVFLFSAEVGLVMKTISGSMNCSKEEKYDGKVL